MRPLAAAWAAAALVSSPGVLRAMPRVDLPAYPTAGQSSAERGRYALWSGEVSAPPELSPGRLEALPPQERLSDAVAAPLGAPDAADQVFINLELDAREGAPFKDAVADLGRAVGFRPDMRFAATRLEASPGRVSLWGWLPRARLAAAVRRAEVRRLSASPAAYPAPGRAVSEMLIGLRLPESDRSGASLERVRAELAASAGVVWRRALGRQTVPGSGEAAVIFLAGVPIRSLARVLAHPDVLRIAPAPADEGPKTEPPWPIGRFLKYAATRAPALLALTGLLLASVLAGAIKRG